MELLLGECIAMGVPIAASPMHSDQPKKRFFFFGCVTDILKIGLAVSQWEDREKLVTALTISEVIESLMASEKGEEMRMRVKELCVATHQAEKERGVSKTELNSFISHITRKLSSKTRKKLYYFFFPFSYYPTISLYMKRD